MPPLRRRQPTPKPTQAAPETVQVAPSDPPLQTIEDGWNTWRQTINGDLPNVIQYLAAITGYAGGLT